MTTELNSNRGKIRFSFRRGTHFLLRPNTPVTERSITHLIFVCAVTTHLPEYYNDKTAFLHFSLLQESRHFGASIFLARK